MMKDFVDKIRAKQDLSFDESKAAFEILMEGKANDQEIFDFLTLLSKKGETSDEIALHEHCIFCDLHPLSIHLLFLQ